MDGTSPAHHFESITAKAALNEDSGVKQATGAVMEGNHVVRTVFVALILDLLGKS